jgi:hypothetical protein
MLGIAILSKMKMGIRVQVFSKISESGAITPKGLLSTLSLTMHTMPKIATSQTITPSCKLSSWL